MNTLYLIALQVIALLCFLVVFVLPFCLVFGGGMAKFALGPLNRCYDGTERHLRRQPEDVSFTYHTYRGLLIWVTQDEHKVHASCDDAKSILKRLLLFNLTWGMLSCGVLFVPFLAIGNYRRQMNRIEEQCSSSGKANHAMMTERRNQGS
ncbi:MAG: hypothetical protein KDB00_02350 [Planctomycetales bacterium]|nr:hypothetical protein [Planctomycetales bacterium]